MTAGKCVLQKLNTRDRSRSSVKTFTDLFIVGSFFPCQCTIFVFFPNDFSFKTPFFSLFSRDDPLGSLQNTEQYFRGGLCQAKPPYKAFLQTHCHSEVWSLFCLIIARRERWKNHYNENLLCRIRSDSVRLICSVCERPRFNLLIPE